MSSFGAAGSKLAPADGLVRLRDVARVAVAHRLDLIGAVLLLDNIREIPRQQIP